MTLRISWSTQTTNLDDAGDLTAVNAEHTLEFDVETRVSHKGTSVLTEHAVESGAPISDHKRATPKTISIEAIVTQTPLGDPPASGYGAADRVRGATREDKEGSGATVYVYPATFDRIRDVETTLERLRLEATPVTLSTRVRTYEQVQLINVAVEESDEDAITLTIDVQEVRIAQTRSIDTPRPREPRAAPTTERGAQEGTDETDERSTLGQVEDGYRERRAAGASRSEALTGALGGLGS